MSNDISKQEYLKRYLEHSKDKRKHKKKLKIKSANMSRLKIIDEDIDIKSIKLGDTATDELDDEQPVIAEVIDDRPLEVKVKELYESSKWKKVNNDENQQSDSSVLRSESKTSEYSPVQQTKISKKSRHDSDSDISPHRQEKLQTSHRRHDHIDRNMSPTRKSMHDSDSDISPPRTVKKVSRKRRYSSDLSPPRQKNSSNDITLSRKLQHKPRNSSDSDISPPRHRSKLKDDQRHLSSQRNLYDSKFMDRSSQKNQNDSDISPPRSSSSKRTSETMDKKPKKTLSGLQAGLQDSETMRREARELRKREKTQINLLDDSVSGRNAETVIRDRKTGLKRDFNKEKQHEDEENKKVEEHQKKYSEWGKGVVQTQSKMEKFAEDVYEMSKPLARYADDEDLDERLKAVIRDDDPMSAYIRKKKEKDKPTFPVYNGPAAPPNRYNIQPGYRWDGVDRSNGFELKYFEKINSTKAIQEESYLWNVQDM